MLHNYSGWNLKWDSHVRPCGVCGVFLLQFRSHWPVNWYYCFRKKKAKAQPERPSSRKIFSADVSFLFYPPSCWSCTVCVRRGKPKQQIFNIFWFNLSNYISCVEYEDVMWKIFIGLFCYMTRFCNFHHHLHKSFSGLLFHDKSNCQLNNHCKMQQFNREIKRNITAGKKNEKVIFDIKSIYTQKFLLISTISQ